jgi:branched-chain amino acid transport system permease protein
LAGWILLGVVLLAVPPLGPPYLISVLSEIFIYAIFAMSLDLLIGYTGLMSLGHSAFFGMGAYAAGVVAGSVGPALPVTLVAALLAAGLLALALGGLAIRASGAYFLMLTLAFSQVVFAVAFKWTPVTGGSNGLTGFPRPTVDGLDFSSPGSLYYLNLAAFALSLLVLRRLVASPLGSAFAGIRENEARMRSIGYVTWRYKLGAFVIAGLFAGLAGALISYYNKAVFPSDLHWTTSGLAMVMVIIGGSGTLYGPVLGAALVLVLQNVVSSLSERWTLIMGLIFIAFVLFARQGIAGLLQPVFTRKPSAAGDAVVGRLGLPAASPPAERGQ